MLNTQFQCHHPFNVGEDFYMLYHSGHGAHLGHMTIHIWSKFCSFYPWLLHMKFKLNQPRGSEYLEETLDEKSWCTYLDSIYTYQLLCYGLQTILKARKISEIREMKTSYHLLYSFLMCRNAMLQHCPHKNIRSESDLT